MKNLIKLNEQMNADIFSDNFDKALEHNNFDR